jgi:hypothetical protein
MHVVTAWIGNSEPIAAKHYLQVTDADFERAAQNAAQQPQAKAENGPQDSGSKNAKAPFFPGLSASCGYLLNEQVGGTGLEPVTSTV